jgi:DegV family protein with EDD domain
MLRIVTDTGSDMTRPDAVALGIELLELEVRFEDFAYDYSNDTDFSVFYKNLERSKNLPKTSLVSPAQYLEVFNDAKEKGDEVLAITISSDISGTHGSGVVALEMCGYDNITLLDSRQCSFSQRLLVEQAVKLRDLGQSRAEIVEALLSLRNRLSLVVFLDTLKYLKKGGRVPAPMALIGEVLNIKPVVIVRDGKIEPLGKVRGYEAGKKILWAQLEESGYDASWPVCFGYTYNKERGEAFMQETKSKFGLAECRLLAVGGVIGTHTGANAIAIAYLKKA